MSYVSFWQLAQQHLLFSDIATTMILSATFDMQTEKQMLGIQLTNSSSAIFNAVTNISNF